MGDKTRAKRTSRGDESIGDLLFMVRKSFYRLRQPRLRHIKVGKFRPQRLRSETLETPKLPGSAVDVFRFTTISTR